MFFDLENFPNQIVLFFHSSEVRNGDFSFIESNEWKCGLFFGGGDDLRSNFDSSNLKNGNLRYFG